MASRRVAGGRARSARPPEPRMPVSRPRQRSRREFTPLGILIRDALRGRPSISHVDRWSRASRATTGYPPCRHPATVPRSVNLCASTVRTPLFLARASRPRRRPLQNLGCPNTLWWPRPRPRNSPRPFPGAERGLGLFQRAFARNMGERALAPDHAATSHAS